MPHVLYLTGANNHDWKRTSAFLAPLLRERLGYTVTVSEDPNVALTGDLGPYALFFLDYNGPTWSDPARRAFETAVHDRGVGVAILHAADNAHTGWEAYETLCVPLWRDGAGHGFYHEYTVAITDTTHPITRGLSDFRTWDELYHNMQNPRGADVHVIATAYSAPEQKGTGNHEPMATVKTYGAGRIFHLLLGHVWPGDPSAYIGNSTKALESDGFLALLTRGCEWAATGQVTATV